MSRIFRIYEISKMRRFSVTIGFFWGAVSISDFAIENYYTNCLTFHAKVC